MRKLTIVLAMTTGVFLGVSCQKEDVGPADALTSTLRADILTCTGDVIDFNSMAEGTLLSSVTSTGGVSVNVTSNNPHYPLRPLNAAIFQSSPSVSSVEDGDLGSGGAGVGTPNAGYSSAVPLGNIVVLHNFLEYPAMTTPTQVAEPNDDDFTATEAPGTIGFVFSSPVTATSLTVIDVEFSEGEYGAVRLYPTQGGALIGAPVFFQDAGQNGVETVSLGNVSGVGYIEVTLGGSIGIDNLLFCRPTPPPPTSQCTRTQGYWKNHSEAWPVDNLTLGGISYTKAELLTILSTPVRGNGLLSLAHQLIAAKLNLASGTDGTVITTALAQADALFVGRDLRAQPQPSLPTSQTSSLTTMLDDYNNGRTGPRHCN